MWRTWAKALGEKASKCDRESDRVAVIRTLIFSTYLITNCFIVAGVLRQWNRKTVVELHSSCNVLETYEQQQRTKKPY